MDSEIEDDSSICSYDSDEEFEIQIGGKKTIQEEVLENWTKVLFNHLIDKIDIGVNPMIQTKINNLSDDNIDTIFHYISFLYLNKNKSFINDDTSVLSIDIFQRIIKQILCFKIVTNDNVIFKSIDIDFTTSTRQHIDMDTTNSDLLEYYGKLLVSQFNRTSSNSELINSIHDYFTYHKVNTVESIQTYIHIMVERFQSCVFMYNSNRNTLQKLDVTNYKFVYSILTKYKDHVNTSLKIDTIQEPDINNLNDTVTKDIVDGIRFNFKKQKDDHHYLFGKHIYEGTIKFEENKINISWNTTKGVKKIIISSEIYDEDDIDHFIQTIYIPHFDDSTQFQYYCHFNRKIVYHNESNSFHIKLEKNEYEKLNKYIDDLKNYIKVCRFTIIDELETTFDLYTEKLLILLKYLYANMIQISNIRNTFKSKGHKLHLLMRFICVYYNVVYTFDIVFHTNETYAFYKNEKYQKLCNFINGDDNIKDIIIHEFKDIYKTIQTITRSNTIVKSHSVVSQTQNINNTYIIQQIKNYLTTKYRAICLTILDDNKLLKFFGISKKQVLKLDPENGYNYIYDYISRCIDTIQYDICHDLIQTITCDQNVYTTLLNISDKFQTFINNEHSYDTITDFVKSNTINNRFVSDKMFLNVTDITVPKETLLTRLDKNCHPMKIKIEQNNDELLTILT